MSGDEGGHAPEPSDLGSEWVEALLGDAPPRIAVDEPAAKTPDGAAPEPADLGDGDWVEALLATPSPRREPGISGPVPVAEPDGPPDAPSGLPAATGDVAWVDALLDSPAPRAPADPPTAEQIATVAEPEPAEAAEDGPAEDGPAGDDHTDLAPVVPLPRGEHTPEEHDPASHPARPGWESHAVEAPLFTAAVPPALELVADPGEAPEVAGQPDEVPAPVPPPASFDLPYADDDDDDDDRLDDGAALAVAAATTGLVRGAIPPRADVPGMPSTLVPQGGVLDLRPGPAVSTPPSKIGRKHRGGDGGRRRALIIAGAAAILIVALVGAQLATERGGEDDGAVITADAASIEAPEDSEERGVSVGITDVEGAEAEGEKDDDAVDAAAAGGTVQGNDAGSSSDATTAGGGGGSQAAPSGRLTISTDRLSLGSGTSGTVQLSNSGGGGLSWSASASGGGYAVSPSSGSISPGQTATLQVGFNPGSLPEGTANGTLSINASGSYSVALAAEVNRPPAISAVGWQSCGATSLLKAHVEDETGEPVTRVVMVGTAPNGAAFRETAVWYGYGNYRAEIGPFSANGAIRYYVEATDSRGNVARSGTVNDSWSNGC